MAPRRPLQRRSRSASPPRSRTRSSSGHPKWLTPLFKKACAAAREDAERQIARVQAGAPHGRLAAGAPEGLVGGCLPALTAGGWPSQGAGSSSATPRTAQEGRRAEADERQTAAWKKGGVAPGFPSSTEEANGDGRVSRAMFLKNGGCSVAKGELARATSKVDINSDGFIVFGVDADGSGATSDAEFAAAGKAATEGPQATAGAALLPQEVVGPGSPDSKNGQPSMSPPPPPLRDRQPNPPPPTSPPPPSPAPEQARADFLAVPGVDPVQAGKNKDAIDRSLKEFQEMLATRAPPQAPLPPQSATVVPPPPPPTTATCSWARPYITIDHINKMGQVLSTWSLGEPIGVLISTDLPLSMAEHVRDAVFRAGGQDLVINPPVLEDKIYQARVLHGKITQAELDIAHYRYLLSLPWFQLQ